MRRDEGKTVGEPEGFREFLAARQSALLRTAWLLTGDEHLAEDLLQSALVKILPRWERLYRAGTVEPYLRTVMATTSTSWWRRRWRGELPSGPRPGTESIRFDQAFDAYPIGDRLVNLLVQYKWQQTNQTS